MERVNSPTHPPRRNPAPAPTAENIHMGVKRFAFRLNRMRLAVVRIARTILGAPQLMLETTFSISFTHDLSATCGSENYPQRSPRGALALGLVAGSAAHNRVGEHIYGLWKTSAYSHHALHVFYRGEVRLLDE